MTSMPQRDNGIGHLLTIAQVCDRLQVGRSTVWKLIGTNQLELVSIGRRIARITERSLYAFERQLVADKYRPPDGTG